LDVKRFKYGHDAKRLRQHVHIKGKRPLFHRYIGRW